jgi:hypothetical protein
MKWLEQMVKPRIGDERYYYLKLGPTSTKTNSKSRSEEDVTEEWRDGYLK